MATKKAGGSSRNGRDSPGKKLGIKKFGNQYVFPGHIIVRQRGTKYLTGSGVYIGKDHTIHAKIGGIVKYTKTKDRTVVNVEKKN